MAEKLEHRTMPVEEQHHKKERLVEHHKPKELVVRDDDDAPRDGPAVGRRMRERTPDHRTPMLLHLVCEWERHRRVRDRVRDRDHDHGVHDVHVHPLFK